MSTRLRIAIGTVYPHDETNISGGIEAVALSLTGALAQRHDLELHVVSCTRSVKVSHVEQRNSIIFHWVATGKSLSSLRAATLDALRVRKVYEEIRPDIIHAQAFSEYALAAPPTMPMVMTIHGLGLFTPAILRTDHYRGPVGFYRRCIGGWIVRQSVMRAKAVISTAGDYVAHAMQGMLNGKPVYEIPNPVTVHVWEAVPKGDDDGFPVLHVGSIIEGKNVVGLVQAFAEVVHRLPEASLHLVGDTSQSTYFTRVQKEVARLGLQGNVVFLGRLNQSMLMQAYAHSALVVVASIQETAPMVIAQAMASGKPVVSTRVGGIPWIVEDGVTGYLVDVGETMSLADRITELLQDKNKRCRMGQAARETARRCFDAQIVADRTVQVYRETLVGSPLN